MSAPGLCSKWKPTPTCLKNPAFTPFPWCHYISSGPCAFSWQPPGRTTLFFFFSHPPLKASRNWPHLWNGTFVMQWQIRLFTKCEQWQEYQCLDDNFQRPVSVNEHRLRSTAICIKERLSNGSVCYDSLFMGYQTGASVLYVVTAATLEKKQCPCCILGKFCPHSLKKGGLALCQTY